MPLPDCIEFVPPSSPIEARVALPGSKSITNRALVLAALGRGETVLRGALWSEDTQVMIECMLQLGFLVQAAPDPYEPGNRVLSVYPHGDGVPRGGSEVRPMELFVGNAGTAARFLTAFLCLGQGCYRLSGVPRMHDRPQAALFHALRQLGYRVDSPNDRLPAVIHGGGPKPGRCSVSVEDSSQFASALLLCARQGGWQVAVEGANEDELPYVHMTSGLVEAFPNHGGAFHIEPDASSGSYFVAANALLQQLKLGRVSVAGWPGSDWQIDARFPQYIPLPDVISRITDLGDSILTAMVLAPFAPKPIRFTDLGRLRVQECERVAAMKTELSKCGVRVEEQGDTLQIWPAPGIQGAEIETYDDHRIAMCFSVLALAVPGIRLLNPGCVKKTFPNFFQKLAASPPQGLGVHILKAGTSRHLAHDELLAA